MGCSASSCTPNTSKHISRWVFTFNFLFFYSISRIKQLHPWAHQAHLFIAFTRHFSQNYKTITQNTNSMKFAPKVDVKYTQIWIHSPDRSDSERYSAVEKVPRKIRGKCLTEEMEEKSIENLLGLTLPQIYLLKVTCIYSSSSSWHFCLFWLHTKLWLLFCVSI